MRLVLGLDLDGVCADFYGHFRHVVAEWKGVSVDELPETVSWGLPEWGVRRDEKYDEYRRIHRWAVTQRELFKNIPPIKGAAQALQRLSVDGAHIRIITHRLIPSYFHRVAVSQTVEWLDNYGFPYHDLCFMGEKALVDADIYVEDGPDNIRQLQGKGRKVIVFSNSTNKDVEAEYRVDNWEEAEDLIRKLWHERETQGASDGVTPN
jgi:5'(3')-deoxyribonucleotidase